MELSFNANNGNFVFYEDGNGVRVGWMKASKFPWYAALFSGSALRCGLMSQCTPPQRVSRLSVYQGKFDELDYNDWKLEQGHYNFSSNRSHIMRDARNQPEFSYFS